MTTTFTSLLTQCAVSLGDPTTATWARITQLWPWCIEAIQQFPILRPMLDDHTNGMAIVYTVDLPSDFREVITVEYPISQQPPTYLVHKNRMDENFYSEAGNYDIDHNFTAGTGWNLYISGGLAASAHIKTQYLANHNTTMLDDSTTLITVADEYVNILVAYVIAKAYRERLGAYITDPTAHTSMILQMTDMVNKAEENYRNLANDAMRRLVESRVTPAIKVDKYDRAY